MRRKQDTIRLLHDPALPGVDNMARDETLMTRVGTGESVPTLRLYAWDPPTISLGYFQRYADYLNLAPPARDLPVVRRLTGGGAILHDIELTYSLTLPLAHHLLSNGTVKLYELVHDAVTAALTSLGQESHRGGPTDDSSPTRGPFFCFARRHSLDVLIGQDKFAGSAQRRTRNALLQHGSIIVGSRFTQQPSATLQTGFEGGVELLSEQLVEQFATMADVVVQPGEWTTTELGAAESLIAKYAGNEWTRRM